jgi:hypothetical protein
MTATLDRPETDFATQLRQQTTGCRLSTFGMTTRRTMSKSQLERVAQTFNAEVFSVGGSRKVIDRKHELVKPIYALLLRAKALIVAHTIDYPERGLRLAKVGKIDWLNAKVAEMQNELEGYLVQLDAGWDEIKQQAREQLGELYCEADYAVTPSRSFGLEISFPAIEPDRRLMTLHPELYAREQARIQSRFDEAVRNAEAAAAEQLQKLLQHFVAKLTESRRGRQAQDVQRLHVHQHHRVCSAVPRAIHRQQRSARRTRRTDRTGRQRHRHQQGSQGR